MAEAGPLWPPSGVVEGRPGVAEGAPGVAEGAPGVAEGAAGVADGRGTSTPPGAGLREKDFNFFRCVTLLLYMLGTR